jgi:hypothetical protein
MGEEDRFENQEQEGYRSLLEKLKVPVRVIDRPRCLFEPETPDIFLNHLRVG